MRARWKTRRIAGAMVAVATVVPILANPGTSPAASAAGSPPARAIVRVDSDGLFPSISADGQHIAYVNPSNIQCERFVGTGYGEDDLYTRRGEV